MRRSSNIYILIPPHLTVVPPLYPAPSAYHTFSKAAADQLGVDANYLYPAALAKQYAPNDPVFQNSTSIYDIAVTFNADFSWWFSTPQDPVGESSNSDGLQGKGTMQDSIHADYAPSENIYDFEQIMVHGKKD